MKELLVAFLLLAGAWLLAGCNQSATVVENGASIHEFTYTEKDVPIYQPRFEREYRVALQGGFVVRCRMENHWSGARSVSGYPHLIEPSGREILFHHDAIAKDIIIPELVNPTADALRFIFALDQQYMNSNPTTVTDDRGKTWRVQP